MPRQPFRYSYFQLTFGQEEAYRSPHLTYERLRRFGYDAIEICPPKGRYGMGVSMEDYLATHLRLKADHGLEVSNVNECWGEMWDPYSPTFKTLTEPKTADLAVSETRSTVDFAAELGAASVTIATAIHAPITSGSVAEATLVAVDALRRMGEHAASRGMRLVFEATNHLEMGKFVNTAANHKRVIELTGRDDIGIQLDFFHVNLEELLRLRGRHGCPAAPLALSTSATPTRSPLATARRISGLSCVASSAPATRATAPSRAPPWCPARIARPRTASPT